MANRTRMVETPSGSGKVYENGKLLSLCRYQLQITQTMIDNGLGGYIDGMMQIRGVVEAPEIQAGARMSAAACFVLHLDDGRKLPFYFSQGDQVRVSGGFQN